MFGEVNKNQHIQSATVALLALNIAYPDAGDEYGEKAGQIVDECCSRMGLPDVRGKLTRKQQALDDAVLETIQAGAGRMEAALVRARLLSKVN
jgi:hypothetical protein